VASNDRELSSSLIAGVEEPVPAEVVIVGGTSGIGRALAAAYVERGARVAVGGRDEARASTVAFELGGDARGFAVDVADPQTIGDSLRRLGRVDRLVVTAILRDDNSVRSYDVAAAIRLSTMKLVGYTEVVHQLVDRFADDASILLYGGLAKDRPYPGSTTVTSVNGAVSTLIRTLAIELAPIRVNAIHPGIVGDTPFWSGKQEALDRVLARTPTGRLVQTSDVVDASIFLLENPAMNGANLGVDGGWMML
jgi:NAD(P)-dependent dehydrogenase (short-subunit alcohol dehydrogenase family)